MPVPALPIKALSRDHLKALVAEAITQYGDSVDLNHIDVSQISNFDNVFKGTAFRGDISRWDMSRAISARSMFQDTPFNGDISTWCLTALLGGGNMTDMLKNDAFTQSISPWDIAQIETNNHDVVNRLRLRARQLVKGNNIPRLQRLSQGLITELADHQNAAVHKYLRLFGGTKELSNYVQRTKFDLVHFDVCCVNSECPQGVTVENYQLSKHILLNARTMNYTYAQMHTYVATYILHEDRERSIPLPINFDCTDNNY